MFKSKGRIDSWPMTGPAFGMPVEFFEPVGKFVLTQIGDEFRVCEIGKANKRGGPDVGIRFNSIQEAIRHIHDNS